MPAESRRAPQKFELTPILRDLDTVPEAILNRIDRERREELKSLHPGVPTILRGFTRVPWTTRVRATFVTWAIRDGRVDGWISDRTGHLTAEMRTRYARTLSDLDYKPFPDVSDAIPELRETPGNMVRLAPRRQGR